ncbi:NADPH dehydrogenase NamA [Siphonobacter sp. SORGH_AS_1065]|uniref:NADPH dehydrogenase NamA n=1 Tax=Siphonobacter sp. SORGH_AS_1065 TaxID=3041795 RepID=UPI002786D4C4|nr:NADPH dehydrogenase NamA [Siphonobacter sp. SORGH_AS_1065]MDQ1087659.1 2,4-dienoyl-CoA reductase-like NADH-dependent reductase (Old Yellow Enzyme family) [Siphonobacter sp. SORGH_AS_1065]
MSLLFSPLTLKKITFRNRIVISPMCQYSSVDGFANDWHLVHLGSRAVGGAGLIIQEATAISPEARISREDLGIWKDEHIEKLQQITSFIRQQGAVAGIQLAHAGRKASVFRPWDGGGQVPETQGGWKPVAPSNIPFQEADVQPTALDKEGIQKVIADFKDAAARSFRAGYEVLEIHAAHGYLIHQFFSPLSNNRTDEYGGSFENRIRILLEILEAVQTVWPVELPVFVRVSATDWVENGWDVEQSVQLAKILKEKGVDIIDTSSGGLASYAKIQAGPNYQVPFSDQIKNQADVQTGAVGIITEAQQAEEILQKGQADLIFIARESLRDPYFPIHAAKVLGDEIKWPSQYERAKR